MKRIRDEETTSNKKPNLKITSKCIKCGINEGWFKYNSIQIEYHWNQFGERDIRSWTPTNLIENESLRNSCWNCMMSWFRLMEKVTKEADKVMKKTTKSHDVYFKFE